MKNRRKVIKDRKMTGIKIIKIDRKMTQILNYLLGNEEKRCKIAEKTEKYRLIKL
jgi:hypothetical protein